jgi:hypothetical protein
LVSFDLVLLDPDEVPTVEQVYEILESDGPEQPLSVRLRAAIDECAARWPGDDAAADNLETPWASWPLAQELELPAVELNIGWEHAATMLPPLIEIASRHEIVLFDPQTDNLHLPPRLS